LAFVLCVSLFLPGFLEWWKFSQASVLSCWGWDWRHIASWLYVILLTMNIRYESGYRLFAETGLACWWAEFVAGMMAVHMLPWSPANGLKK
jgi:hypothetical protein